MSPPPSDGLITIFLICCALGLYFARSREQAPEAPVSKPVTKSSIASEPVDDRDGPYSVYDQSFDQEVTAASLVTDDEAALARKHLEQHLVGAQKAPNAMIDRLRRSLLADGSPPLAVTLLIDNSGSMRSGDPVHGLAPPNSNIVLASSVAVAINAALEDLKVSTEILGFTTVSWRGGQARKSWINNGRPPYPGRLCDLRHIIYKTADEVGPDGRKYLGIMLRNELLKENVDGEALLWARDRLLARPEPRRILIVISDGAPVDDSSLHENGPNFLVRHFREVISQIEVDPSFTLAAVGIREDVSNYYRRSVTIKDGTDPIAAAFDLLARALANDKPGAVD